jgi:hypothetical protein
MPRLLADKLSHIWVAIGLSYFVKAIVTTDEYANGMFQEFMTSTNLSKLIEHT